MSFGEVHRPRSKTIPPVPSPVAETRIYLYRINLHSLSLLQVNFLDEIASDSINIVRTSQESDCQDDRHIDIIRYPGNLLQPSVTDISVILCHKLLKGVVFRDKPP